MYKRHIFSLLGVAALMSSEALLEGLNESSVMQRLSEQVTVPR